MGKLSAWHAGMLCFLVAGSALAAAPSYPPLGTEVSPDHPLFIFRMTALNTADPVAYGQSVVQRWNELSPNIRPYSTLRIDMEAGGIKARHQGYRAALGVLQEADVPVVIQLADADPRRAYPLGLAEELLRDFACVKGVDVAGLSFNAYYQVGPAIEAAPQEVRWLTDIVDLAARYGRFAAIELDGLHWPRLMSNASSKRLYATFSACKASVMPIALNRGGQSIARMTSCMGLWLEGAAQHWGVGPTSGWYADAGFLEPGLFGRHESPNMPSSLYRAMILNGAMTGATVYSFDEGKDLWFGENRAHWDEAIQPALAELLELGLIARRQFVEKKAQVAFQLNTCRTPADFRLSMKDIDGVYESGNLIRGAYGMERPGQIPELIPNSGRNYWIPILSPYASEERLKSFARVVQPGVIASPQGWIDLLDRYYRPDGVGTAFISRVGRGVFVMNTHENQYEEQTFRVPGIPAPVRGLEAKREGNVTTVTWPFREGDFAYRVYRRTPPAGEFALVANDLETRTWQDKESGPNDVVAYAVTTLTNETELYEGTVNYGDYLALSVVESRIAEEVVISPLLGFGRGRPVERPADQRPKGQVWWPTFEGVPEERLAVAKAVVERIEKLDQAFTAEDLGGVMDVYASDYEDPEGWRAQYVQRAYQWFFERYRGCRMTRQIRRWDFDTYDSSREVRVLLYVRFAGAALSDPSGRVGDPEAYFPRTDTGEVWLTFAERDSAWRVVRSEPALPNFKDILSFATGPYDGFGPGPDKRTR